MSQRTELDWSTPLQVQPLEGRINFSFFLKPFTYMNVVTTLPIMQLGDDFVVESFRTKLMIILVTSS